MLVWARWGDTGGQSDKSGQYILSFEKKGEYRSSVEVDWKEMLVQQFEVFGSGQFLLRGRRPDRSESRLAILSSGGTELQDVIGWPGVNKPVDEPSPEGSITRFDHAARGGDGRIYVAHRDARPDEDVVYAFGPSGDSQELFTLRSMPRTAQFLGWKVAGIDLQRPISGSTKSR